MTDFTMKTDADGVAIITWDVPVKSMNVMSIAGLSELDAIIDKVLSDDSIKGAVITSGKDGSFAGGMDLNLLAKILLRDCSMARCRCTPCCARSNALAWTRKPTRAASQ